MQRAVGRPVIVECVFPTQGELAGLTFAIPDVLAEVDTFLRRNIQSDRISQVLKRQLTVLIRVKPIEDRSYLVIRGDEAPEGHKLRKSIILDIVVRRHPPFIENTLY